MLVVLIGFPITAPTETVLFEQSAAKVTTHNLVGKLLCAVAIWLGGSGLDKP